VRARSHRQGNQLEIGEVDMFARKVAVLLKPNSLPEFTKLMENQILPWLRKQEGFLDLIILAARDGREVATISFWDHQASAEAYNTSGYPEVVEILQRLLDGVPYLKTFDVVSSTFPRDALFQRCEAERLVGIGPTRTGYGSATIGPEG
jgi:heme-degrading monooxygenase HmoA